MSIWLLATVLAAEPMMLDLGGPHGPTLPSFRRVWADGSDDARVSWQLPARATEVAAFPDALSDALHGGVLHLELAPGTWALHVLALEAPPALRAWPEQPWGLWVDGSAVWTVEPETDLNTFLASPAYALPRPAFRLGETVWERRLGTRWPWRSAEVQVGDEGLTLALRGVPLAALVAIDASQDSRSLLARIDLSRRHDFLEHTALGDDLIERGGVGLELASWGSQPDASRAGVPGVWELSGVPGELVGGILWLHGQPGPIPVKLTGLSCADVELREVLYNDSRGQPRAREPSPRPVALAPLTHGRLLGGQGLPVGLSVAVTPRGSCRGRIKLGRLSVPLRVETTDLQLAPATPTGLFTGPSDLLTRRTGALSEEVLALLDEELAMMSRLGLTAVALRNSFKGVGANETLFRHVAERWQALGGKALLHNDLKRLVRNAGLYETGLSPDTLDSVRGAVGSVETGLEVVFSVFEEEGWRSVDAVSRAPSMVSALREVLPDGTQLGANMGHPQSLRVAGAFDVIVWGARPWPRRAEADALRAQGQRVWIYNQGGGRGGPLIAWHVGAEAHLEWRLADAPGDPFDHVSPGSGSLYGLLGPDGHAWPTVGLLRFARGVAEARYVITVERRLLDGACSAAWRADAGGFVRSVHGALDTARPQPQLAGEIWPDETYDRVFTGARALLARCP